MINEKNARKFCRDDIRKIENYDKAVADQTQMWVCHHRTEIWWNCSEKDLQDNDCYYGRKALELIFLTESEHKSLHMSGERNPNYGKHLSEETRRKLSEANTGKSHGPMSEEHRRNLSASCKAAWERRKAAKRKAAKAAESAEL